jgi:hypothetical protein
MQFQPRTEQQIRDSKLFPKGTYDFEIIKAEETTSKSSGRPMIELALQISGPAGARKTVKDYLVEKTDGKLRHAAEACGLIAKYETGSLSDTDFLHKKGKVMLTIEKDKKKMYPDRNAVLDYVTVAKAASRGLAAYTR